MILFKCPLAPACTEERSFEQNAPHEVIEASLKEHINEHSFMDFLKVIEGLREDNQKLVEVIELVGQAYTVFTTVGDRVSVLLRQRQEG